METPVRSFLFLFAIFIINSATNAQKTVQLPVRKDPKTLQYYTTIQMGSNRVSVNAVIDLGSDYLWFGCDNYTTDTYAPIPCGTGICAAPGSACVVECFRPGRPLPRPGCTNNTCFASNFNPFQNVLVGEGFYFDTLFSKDRAQELVPRYIFSCMGDDFLQGLASGVTGLVGLARTDLSLRKQVANRLNLPDKFSLCLPRSSGLGKLTIGEDTTKIHKLLKTTSLIINPNNSSPRSHDGDPSVEYFIDVKSIRVNNKSLSLKNSFFSFDQNGNGGTKISSIQNYTALHPSIYETFTKAFNKAASDLKIKKAAAVAPFSACFSSSSISKTASGPVVPSIDLVLPGTDVYWRISGANSMVQIDKKTTCLGFVEAGPIKEPTNVFGPRASILIGTRQLEDNLLVFDLVSSQLQFSSSLIASGRSCSRV